MPRVLALFAGDVIAFVWAWTAAVALAAMFGRAQWSQLWPLSNMVGTLYLLGVLVVFVVFALGGHYTKRAAFWDEVRAIWRSLVLVALSSFAMGFFVQVTYTRVQFILAWLLAFALVPLLRLAVREVLLPRGMWRLRALLVGTGDNAEEARLAVRQERHLGLEIVARVDEQALSSAEAVAEQAAAQGCSAIIIASQEAESPSLQALVEALDTRQQFEVFVVPPLWGLPVHGMQVQSFVSRDVVFLRLRQNLLRRRAMWIKRAVDIMGASMALVLLSPVMLWAVLRIWLEDGCPVFYTQRRVGQGGREFDFYKFRSMVCDADAVLERWSQENPGLYAQFQENFKLADDPRVLKVGGFMRKTSIDELPQFWNVLRGDMSLVGPRPFPHRELERFTPEAIQLYKSVKPGITGLWQVSGRSDAAFEQRLALNNWYVRNWSLWLDFVILMKTVRVVLSGRGAV